MPKAKANATPIAFSGGPFNHDETGRSPIELQNKLEDKTARAILLQDDGPLLTRSGELLSIHPKDLIGKHLRDPGPLYLGLDKDAPLFAASVQNYKDFDGALEPRPVEDVASQMQVADLAIAGRAISLFDWHQNHRFCANCGQGTRNVMGGLKRDCIACETEHFPRVNPAVIMLVIHKDQVLIGRQAEWPEGTYSALAGYVSPGETIEEACYREVWEEVGLKTSQVKYLYSQPWPFPSQLMIGLTCHTQDTTLNINRDELDDAIWVSQDELKAVLAKTSTAFEVPPKFSLARQLLQIWANS